MILKIHEKTTQIKWKKNYGKIIKIETLFVWYFQRIDIITGKYKNR